jgi:hypothetical protein
MRDHAVGPIWNGTTWQCICGFITGSDIEARAHAYLADEMRQIRVSNEWNETRQHD